MAHSGTGIFLDLDGTLANSLKVMRIAYNSFLDRFGKLGSDAEFSYLNGPPLSEIVQYLGAKHELSKPHEELLTVYRQIIKELYLDVIPNAGATDLLNKAKLSGHKTGVVTSNSIEQARHWLRQVDLIEKIDIIVASDDVRCGKPAPEPYLLALERAECAARKSFAVEDSLSGARAALSAGIPTFLLSSDPDGTLPGTMTVSNLGAVATRIYPAFPK